MLKKLKLNIKKKWPGRERDLEGMREFFENPQFRADGIKIYPTLVIRGTGLYELWKTGRYKNYTPDELVDVIAQILAMVTWIHKNYTNFSPRPNSR